MLRGAQADAANIPSQSETAFLLPSSGGRASGSGGSGGSGRGLPPVEPAGDRLAIGQHVGRYEVLDLLGAGGMGRVYRALDASLGREVAIKGLADAFRGDSRSLRRFEREARVLATLSHPNIAAIYGFERLNGSPYLVLERVEGETLAHRLARGPLPLEEALAIAVQIVAGLEEAHAKGVIHRDLKPSNVMLAPGRQVKLVDFGLAKTATVERDVEESIEPITEIGLVVGTARYMSPEQVTGGDVDTRTDVWAFGCVLFEMLAGRPVFSGRSVSEVAAALLRDEPDWSALRPEVPRAVTRLIRRCLRRDPRTRLQHIGDARIELLDLEQDAESQGMRAVPPPRRRALQGVIVAALMLAALAAGFLLRPRERASGSSAQLSLELPAPLTFAPGFSAPFALAPDGSRLAIEATDGGTRRLYLRELRDPELRRLPGTDGAWQPFFSADGRWLAFFTQRKLSKMAVGGGPVIEVADIGGNPRGATWASDGSIVVAPTQTAGLMRVSDRGGPPVALTTLDKSRDEYSHRWPDAIPGTRWVLFTVGVEDGTFDEGRIEAVSLETGERRAVLTGAGFARYLPDNRLLFVRGGLVYTVGFDPQALAVRGTPEVLLDAIRYDWRNGGSHLAVSTSGVMVYGPGQPSSHEYYLSWVGHEGGFQRAVDTPRRFRDLQRSPDGGRIAVVVGTSTESDLLGGRWERDAGAAVDGALSISSDVDRGRPRHHRRGEEGREVAPAHDPGRWLGRARRPAREREPLVSGRVVPRRPSAAVPGEHSLDRLGSAQPGRRRRRTSGRNTEGVRGVAVSRNDGGDSRGTADGWPTNRTSSTAWCRIYVRSWPDGGRKVQASNGGGRLPAWGPNGDLYYWQTGEDVLRVVRTRETNGPLTLGTAEPVWPGDVGSAVLKRLVITVPNGRFDIDPPGARFLALEQTSADAGPDLKSPVVVVP